MKKITTVIMILSTIVCLGQEAWELPMKNDMVYFQFKEDGFNNKKKFLIKYFNKVITNDAGEHFNTTIRSEMSKKGGKYFSNTDYAMYQMAGNENIKDTIIDGGTIGIQTITQNRNTLHIFGEKSSNFEITAKIKITFTEHGYKLNIRGFTIKNRSVNTKKGSVQTNEAFIEDSYKEFLADKKKDKAEIKFYTELKELLGSFNTLLKDQMQHEIKVGEID